MEGSFYVLYFSVSLFLSFLFSGQAECLHPFCCAMIIKSHPFLGRRLFVCLFVVATLRGIMGGCMHVPGEALGQISDCHLHNTASSEGRKKNKFATVNRISVLDIWYLIFMIKRLCGAFYSITGRVPPISRLSSITFQLYPIILSLFNWK